MLVRSHIHQVNHEKQLSFTHDRPEEPNTTNMDISTGHMVLAYMEDHLKNKQRLEQEWVALCSYEAEPCATTIAFKAENKKKNRYPDKLPFDHNRVILNAMVNGTNSDYINASTVVSFLCGCSLCVIFRSFSLFAMHSRFLNGDCKVHFPRLEFKKRFQSRSQFV